MKIEPKDGLLLIKKHSNTQLKADIAIEDDDADKTLITGTVIAGGESEGKTVIFGKYALFKLKLKGEDYYFLDIEDVIGFCDYYEE
jgi:co-chaperonin GroES (HSP10)